MEGTIQFLTKEKLEEVLQVGKVDAGNGTLFGVRTQRPARKEGLTLVISSGGEYRRGIHSISNLFRQIMM